MMNQILLIGRLVNDVEVKELENGTKVSNITLAVPRSYKNADGEYDTDFIKCSLWNGVAENTANYCKTGDMLGVRGRIQTNEIETENGKHKELSIVAEKITFLVNSKEKSKEDENSQENEI